jgi:hypothetical protein
MLDPKENNDEKDKRLESMCSYSIASAMVRAREEGALAVGESVERWRVASNNNAGEISITLKRWSSICTRITLAEQSSDACYAIGWW